MVVKDFQIIQAFLMKKKIKLFNWKKKFRTFKKDSGEPHKDKLSFKIKFKD